MGRKKSKTGSKRKRSVEDTGNKPKKVRKKAYRKFNGVEDADFKRIKPAGVRKELRAMVRTFHKMVDSDWHDGYEEQGEYLTEFAAKVEEIVQSVYNVSIVPDLPKEAYQRLNESLRLCCDQLNNIQSVPARGGVFENDDSEISIDCSDVNETKTLSIPHSVGQVWKIVLCASVAAGVYIDSELLRFLKDFSDCVGEDIKFEEVDDQVQIDKHDVVKNGKEKLYKLWEEEEWKKLDSNMKKYKPKRVIDRRYDGELSKRTRAYDSEGNYAMSGGSGCSIQ